jgi:hypothetical protein
MQSFDVYQRLPTFEAVIVDFENISVHSAPPAGSPPELRTSIANLRFSDDWQQIIVITV